MPQNPLVVYQERLAAHQSAQRRHDLADARLSISRLGVFAVAVATAILVWRGDLPLWALVVPGICFLVLIVWHERVIRARHAVLRAIAHYERGLARIEDRWIGTGEPGTRFQDEHHPYAVDLDLFGPGSIFELLSTARTRDGEAALAGWLLTGARPATIRERQQAVAELAPVVLLREQMAIVGDAARIAVDTDGIRDWAMQAALPGLGRLRFTTCAAAAASVAATTLLAATGNALPLQVLFVIQIVIRQLQESSVDRILNIASGKARELDALTQLLRHLESGVFVAARLVTLRGMLATPVSASRAIASLQRLAERYAWRHSLPLVPVAFVGYAFTGADWALDAALVCASAFVLFTPFLALAVERWRRLHGPHVGGWMAALGEFEATLALAGYQFEHPQDPFPVIEDGGLEQAAVFDGTALGHPLVPAERMVRNDVQLTAGLQLLMVSGSNMSGKSTLLRTVGVNTVLALAGAPVRAASLRLTPLAIGATLRIEDSLRDGRSRFFAEITRIRMLSDLAAGPVPLLFLLDEVLSGTNSHDRLIGASGILRALIARGAIGLATTHDLALTAVADDLAPRAANIHFDDSLDGEEMHFDYLAKPGPVTRSNALALMRAVGLELEPEA